MAVFKEWDYKARVIARPQLNMEA